MGGLNGEHRYQTCRDPGCERFPCRVYDEGYRRGYDDGKAAGFAEGYAAGYGEGHADGYAEGAASAARSG
jgi:hypothetical protein